MAEIEVTKTESPQAPEKPESTQVEKPQAQAVRRRAPATLPPSWTHPFAVMQRLIDDMEQSFEDFGFARGLMPRWLGRKPRELLGESLWSPDVEVEQRGDKIVVCADVPGLKKDDLNVTLTEDGLVLEGERRIEEEKRQRGYYRSERRYGSFYRLIPLPAAADTASAAAKLNNGVLEVSFDCAPELAGGRKVEIEEEAEKQEVKKDVEIH